jgi:hypothetical protein
LQRQPNDQPILVGISFDIGDLTLLQAWADLHGMRMVVELDQCVDGHEYEEIVVIYSKSNGLRRWNLWRSQADVVVQPFIGRSMRFASVTDAVKALLSIGR